MLSDVEMMIWGCTAGAVVLSLLLFFFVLWLSDYSHKLINAIVAAVGSLAFYLVWFIIMGAVVNMSGGSSWVLLFLPFGYLGFILLCWALKLGKL